MAVEATDAADTTPEPSSDTEDVRDAISPWSAVDWHKTLSNPKGYRGNVTAQGMTGMFINPTAGTLDQGQFTLQYCVLLSDKPDFAAHGILAPTALPTISRWACSL